jgi:peptidyl-prolyl cis-trans isomerase C
MNRSPSAVRPLTVVPAFALLAAWLAGCSAGPDVLAKVGDRAITRDEFLDVARRAQGQYPGTGDSAKANLLEDLIKRQMLVMAAEKQGLVDAAHQARLLRETREQFALRALIQRLAPEAVPVSDAELRALYAQRAQEAHALVVFTPDSTTCAQARAEIEGGADFGAVADRFNMTGMTPAHGDLGFRAPGSLVPALDRVVTDEPVGKLIGPVESPGNGWFLVKIVERRARKQEPFDQERDALRQMIQGSKRRTLLDRAHHELLAQYHVRLEPGATQVLFERYNVPKDTISVGRARMPVPAPPTPEEARQVLARYDGTSGKPATYTLGDAVQDLQNEANPHPNFLMTPMIDQWLRTMMLQKVLALETRRRHIEEEPAVIRQARERVNNELLQATYNTLVMSAVTASEADIRAAFERHAAELVQLRNAQLRIASTSDSAAARRAGQAIGRGAGFDEAVRAAGASAQVTESEAHFPTTDPVWSRLESSVVRMKPGETAGPLNLAHGWLMFQVVRKTEIPQPYEQLDQRVKQALEGEALELKRERRLNELTDSLRRQYRPVVNRGRLARIRWPVPPAAGN